MESIVYNQEGKKAGSVTVSETVFGARWNADLVHQVVTSMQKNARLPIAHTKDRGEVRGGGKKPWRQKGTGRARHGSSRSPIWKGGGVTFGPSKEKSYEAKIPKKMRAAALFAVISKKYKNGEVLFLDALLFKGPKTADAKKVLAALSGVKGFEDVATKRKNAVLVALPAADVAAEKSFRNFGNVSIEKAQNLNPVAVLSKKYLVIVGPEDVSSQLERRIKN